MKKRMLIDATHEEETRVAIIENDRLKEFDYESKYRKALKGSIFLAKVTRVEPSLQAAFVNFGGNRHGFLPFSEIHPDYFRIPIADREALIAEQEALLEQAQKAEEEAIKREQEEFAQESQEGESEEAAQEETRESGEEMAENISEGDSESEEVSEDASGETQEESQNESQEESQSEDSGEEGDGRRGRRRGRDRRRGRGRGRHAAHRSRRDEVAETPEEAERRFRFNLRRRYKIQEVIKRGQIMLVQVSKEERGNKGAAVGTYLSLPGRYCVLMPNSPRAGGVSRKIASHKDRNHMREIMKDLEVPKGMSVILRTAGLERTKVEIKRDLDYLVNLWNEIRALTLESSAPALVYEEADLIKRAVRDIYTRDIEEVLIAGEEGYKTAKNFMKMMIPSHVKKIVEYKDQAVPLFNKYKVERQIAEIGEAQVTLPSGGYLVINPTEALISIDVNSGRATKERHIEETALKTNLEAAEEVARQLRLRDLGGLVVIDFIDMEDRRNNAKVEQRLRGALSTDRARVQVGRISSFGLLELSRQRLNPSLTEAQFEVCKHCEGLGRIRSADATSIMVLRAIEDEGIKARAAQVVVHVSSRVAMYLLNNKRASISALEQKYKFQIVIRADDEAGASGFRVEVGRQVDRGDQDEGEPREHRRDDNRRDDRQRGENRNRHEHRSEESESSVEEDAQEDASEELNEEQQPRDNRRFDGENRGDGRDGGRRRRGRRGGRNRNRNRDGRGEPREEFGHDPDFKREDAPRHQGGKRVNAAGFVEEDEDFEDHSSAPVTAKEPAEAVFDEKPARGRGRGKKAVDDKEPFTEKKDSKEPKGKISNDEKPQSARKPAAERAAPKASAEYETVTESSGDKKKGWWNKLTGE